MYLVQKEDNFIFDPSLRQVFKNQFTLNVGSNEIVKMMNNKELRDEDLAIAKMLFKLRFLSLTQITRLLKIGNDEASVLAKLNKLVKNRIVNEFVLTDEITDNYNENAFKIYCLDLGGKYLLENYSEEDVFNWYSTVNMKSVSIISKLMVASELYVRLMETCPEKVLYFNLLPELRMKTKVVIPTFEVGIKSTLGDKTIVGDVVEELDCERRFRERVSIMDSIFDTKCWKKFYGNSDTPPIMFLIATDDITALRFSKGISDMDGAINFRTTTIERMKMELFGQGAFLKYVPEKDMFKEVKAVMLEPEN